MTEPMQYDVQLYPVLTVIKFRGKRFAPPAVLTLNEGEAALLIAKGYLGGGMPMPETEPQDPPAPESEPAEPAGLDGLAHVAAGDTADHTSYADMPESSASADSLDQAGPESEPGPQDASDAPASHAEGQLDGEQATAAPCGSEDTWQATEAAVGGSDAATDATGQGRPAGKNKGAARPKGK